MAKVKKKIVKKAGKKAGAKASAKAGKKASKEAGGKAGARFVKAKHAGGGTGGMGEARGDLGQPGAVAIERLPEPKRAIARAADALIRSVVPGCASVVKWGNAVYSVGEGEARLAFASLMETKAGVNLALPGAGLSDPHGLLEGTGKMMRHIKLRDVGAVERAGVRELIQAASKVGLAGM